MWCGRGETEAGMVGQGVGREVEGVGGKVNRGVV